VLGALAGEGERRTIEVDARRVEQRAGRRHFQRRRRAEAGADRHVAADLERRADEPVSGAFEHRGDAAHVIAPMAGRSAAGRVEIEFDRLTKRDERTTSRRSARGSTTRVCRSMATGITKPSL
jgi:hypothetical protein